MKYSYPLVLTSVTLGLLFGSGVGGRCASVEDWSRSQNVFGAELLIKASTNTVVAGSSVPIWTTLRVSSTNIWAVGTHTDTRAVLTKRWGRDAGKVYVLDVLQDLAEYGREGLTNGAYRVPLAVWAIDPTRTNLVTGIDPGEYALVVKTKVYVRWRWDTEVDEVGFGTYELQSNPVRLRVVEWGPGKEWGMANGGFRLAISFPKSPFTNGEPIVGTARLQNVTDGFLSHINLLTSYLELAVASEREGRLAPKRMPEVPHHVSIHPVEVAPAEEDDFAFAVSPEYDLASPGSYTVNLRLKLPTGEVVSPGVPIRVLPK